MFAPFIPPAAQRLQDADAIALLHRICRQPVMAPELHGDKPVPTAVVAPDAEPSADRPPLLLLHGFDSSLLEFRHLMPELAAHWSVWAIDLLGFGFTAHLPGIEVNPSTIRRHLYASWQTLIDRPMTLLGASLGGAVAIDFALHYPDCVEQLILINSVGFSGSFPLGKWLFSPLLDWGTDWLHFRKDTVFRVAEALPFISPQWQDWVLCSSLHQAMPGWQEAVKSFTRSGGYNELPALIAKVQQPTLILWGDQDKTLSTEDARKFEQAITNSHLEWIRGANHAPHIHQPATIAAALLKHRRRRVDS